MPGTRASPGEYGSRAEILGYARRLFLWMVGKRLPQVLRELRDDALEVYSSAYGEVARRADPDQEQADKQQYGLAVARPAMLCTVPVLLTRWKIVGQACTVGETVRFPDLLRLRTALEAWAQPRHIEAPWVYDAALLQLDAWRDNPGFAASEPPFWIGLKGSPCASPEEQPFVLRMDGYDPTWETRSQADERIRACFEEELRGHLDAAEALVESIEGFERTKQYRELERHMQWFVLYQVDSMPYRDIVRLEKKRLRELGIQEDPRDAVRKAVPRVADLIGLKIRKGDPPGRPPFSTTLETRDHSETRSREHRRRR